MKDLEKNRAIVSFERLRDLLFRRKMSVKEFVAGTGIPRGTYNAIISGSALPKTDKVAGICAFLRCTVDDILEFKGIEVSERYGWHRSEPKEPVYGMLTYEPLRNLFKNFYGGEWKSKLKEFYDKVPKNEDDRRHETSKRLVRIMNPGVGDVTKSWYGDKGLGPSTRTKLNNDRAVTLDVIYRMCLVLHCTPDYIMDYN